MFMQAEEDVDTHSNCAACRILRSEVRDSITLDGVLLVVQGQDDLGDVLKRTNRGVRGEEDVSGEEDEVHEGTELDYSVMASVLCVLA